MLQNLKKKQEGFTIIEVMIVLVIAAVILLIVFLAVPALQRNSRNTQKKNIAADIAAATAEFTSNLNGGTLQPSSSSTADSHADKILKLVNTNGIITELEIANCTSGYLTICNEYDTGSETRARVLIRAKCTNNVSIYGSSNKEITVAYRIEAGSPQACLATGI